MRFGGIVLAAALLLTTACAGDPEPQEPTPTPTPSSTATLPPMPEQAKEDSPEGAAAFVDHWVDVFNYASQTGDVEELSRLSDMTCSSCDSYVQLFEDTYQSGGFFRGGEWELGDVKTERVGSEVRVFGHVDAAAGVQGDGQGNTGPTDPENVDLLFVLRAGDAEWFVADLSRVQS